VIGRVESGAREIAQAIIDRIDAAWEHQGVVPPDVLTDDALYTNIPGELFRGREGIVAGTGLVKAHFKTRVTSRLLLEARYLTADVIIALVRSTATVPEGPQKGDFSAHQLYVIVRDADEEWRIAAYQATRIASP
jgi:uncharacterized protein (TIGR02246 family)